MVNSEELMGITEYFYVIDEVLLTPISLQPGSNLFCYRGMDTEKHLHKTCTVRPHDIQAFALHYCSVQLTERALPL
jgi:hypothetical protein